MVKKSLHRFYFFGLALLAALFFFGEKSDHVNLKNRHSFVFADNPDSFYSSSTHHQPFEIENKEEQPTAEDDESKESGYGDYISNFDSISLSQKNASLSGDGVVSKSQTEYHTPVYVRLRSILI
jgi:hypothetical protein